MNPVPGVARAIKALAGDSFRSVQYRDSVTPVYWLNPVPGVARAIRALAGDSFRVVQYRDSVTPVYRTG